jgi:hypothetical protein
MAYDLLLRRHVPSSFSREGGIPAAVAGGVAVLAALGCLIIPKVRRQAENQRYRREYADDLGSKALYATQESPAISMAELVRQPWER